MQDDRFEEAENEYFRLKGQLSLGRISRDQFDAALKELMLQDARGRNWMLGAESGRWYVHDGRTWIEAQPVESGWRPPAMSPAAGAQPRGSSKLPFIAVGCLVLLCLGGTGGLGGAWGLGLLRVGIPVGTPTLPAFAFLPPTLAPFALPTLTLSAEYRVPKPTALALPSPTLVSVPTETPTATPTEISVQPTPTPTIPPGVYVTNLRLDPPVPQRRQEITFIATFLNTTDAEQKYRWLVYVYREGPKPFGQTSSDRVYVIPVGTVEEPTVNTWKLTGGGECENFVARVAWLNQDRQPVSFSRPGGQVFELPFTVCP